MRSGSGVFVCTEGICACTSLHAHGAAGRTHTRQGTSAQADTHTRATPCTHVQCTARTKGTGHLLMQTVHYTPTALYINARACGDVVASKAAGAQDGAVRRYHGLWLHTSVPTCLAKFHPSTTIQVFNKMFKYGVVSKLATGISLLWRRSRAGEGCYI